MQLNQLVSELVHQWDSKSSKTTKTFARKWIHILTTYIQIFCKINPLWH